MGGRNAFGLETLYVGRGKTLAVLVTIACLRSGNPVAGLAEKNKANFISGLITKGWVRRGLIGMPPTFRSVSAKGGCVVAQDGTRLVCGPKCDPANGI